MEQRQTVIDVSKAVKRFGSFTALDGLDLNVRKGEVHGFLGPNGSGKSTTIRIILGLLRLTEGEVTLFGQDPWKDAVSLHKRLAYVPGDVNFWPNLSGGEIIDLLGDLRGGLSETRRKELLKRLELDPRKKSRTYSKGNRQKVALVAALASDVELYILDEPTSGLDPLMESVFQEEIKALKKQGKTILLSSHILAEVEALCDRVTIIRSGRTVEADALGDLRKKHRINFTVEAKEALAGLAAVAGVHNVNKVKQTTTFQVETAHINEVLKFLSKHTVHSVISQPPALEDLFLRHYDESETGPVKAHRE